MYFNLTKGSISRQLILFSLPMMAGSLLQQMYNIADTLIVARVLGTNALAAVGSAYTLMTFITSLFLGLSLGSGAFFSICKGENDEKKLRRAIFHSFSFILVMTIIVNILLFLFIDPLLQFLSVPAEVYDWMKSYLLIIYGGILATSIYNFLSCLLRALGNSTVPLIFLAVSTVLNIFLDILFVAFFSWGIEGAAIATIIAQYVSAIGLGIYFLMSCRSLLPRKGELAFDRGLLGEIASLSTMTCLQQSVMNFGILLVQGLVNSFGAVTMAAFAAAVKVDSFAYLPVQEFGNAYSTFIAQNNGAGEKERIRKGTAQAFLLSGVFSIIISLLVFCFAAALMSIFTDDPAVTATGVQYLRTEGACYIGIGWLFLFYGYFRGMKRAGISLVLTIISLGLRVVLAYLFSAFIGEVGIWISIPIGWLCADITGYLLMRSRKA